MSAPRPTIVVGAGLGGLAAALRLAAAGRDVEMVEAGAAPGGRCGLLEVDGFSFDTGPAVLTLPHLIEELFAATGASMSDYLELVPLDPIYRACFADGSEISVPGDPRAMADEVRRTCGDADGAGFERLVDWLRALYKVEWPNFIDRNLDGLADYRLAPLVRLVAMGGLRRLYPAVARFVSDPRLRRLFSFQAIYAGLSPFDALAIYGVISYMDTVAGVFFPRGGMHALPRAMATRAAELGVKIRYRAPVARVEADSDGVRGVRLASGEQIEAATVVVNADLPWAYEHLLPGVRPPRRLARMRYSPSAWLMLAGIQGSFPGAAHHNIHFGSDYRGAFDDLIGAKQEMRDPSVLLSLPSVTDPTLAPTGHTSAYYLVPVPSLPSRLDWSQPAAAAFRHRHLSHLEALGYEHFEKRITFEKVTTPVDWLAQGMARGTPFSLSHRFFQTGAFRPPNVDPRVPGLVFVGSGTVPGVGVPMVLVSGGLAAERVLTGDR